MNKIETVALIGLGAIGAFFAPRLHAALGDGFRVVAGGERGERLRERGVTINGVVHHFNIVSPEEETGPAELVIIAVKDYGLDQALVDVRNQVGDNTIILSVLNGVTSEERVGAVFGREKLLYSLMRVSIAMRGGVTNFDTEFGRIHFGEARNDVLSERVLRVNELFDRAGICYANNADMIQDLWYKFMCNVSENLPCALLGEGFGVFHTNEHANALRRALSLEVVAVAQAEGVDFGEAQLAEQELLIPTLPPQNRASTLQDLERGYPMETELFAGTVMRLGAKHGIATPVNEMFYHSLMAIEELRRAR